jgi:exopolysaccharide biosynthesis polyprenyl glycosylphosphotransferase
VRVVGCFRRKPLLQQQAKLVAFFLYTIDLIIIISSFLLVYWMREAYLPSSYKTPLPLTDYLPLFFSVLPMWSVFLYSFGLYKSFRTKSFWAELWAILKVSFWGMLCGGALVFALRLPYINRRFIFIFSVVAFLLLSIERALIRTTARRARTKGFNYRNIIIVGTGRRAREIAKLIEEHEHWGIRLTGIVTDTNGLLLPKSGPYPVLGQVSQMSEILYAHVVDEVLFAVSRKKLEELEKIFLICEELGVRTRVAVNFFPNMIAKVHLDDFHGIPLLTFTTTPHDELQLAVKRVFDIAISVLLLLVALPVSGMIALLIKATSTGPIIFKQVRLGLNGRSFNIYKFRTMHLNAEEKKKELMHLNQMQGPVFKVKDDPRLTPVGGWLRKWSLDELPQLINVLKGQMSIVGPRPPLPDEVVSYSPWQRRRLSMKPGLTCLWQVNGRNTIKDFDQWMKLDLEYIDNWSLSRDFKIFLKTIPVVLLGKGAS